MRIARLCSAAILIVGLSCARNAQAQQCFTYSPNVSSYVDESTDGTYVYTSVEVSGNVDMNINPTCAPYLPQYIHTPGVFNQITAPNGASVGGWVYGNPVCETCYFDAGSTETMAATPGLAYDFYWQAEATCSGGGEFYGGGGWVSLAIATTTYHIQTVNENGTVTFKQACPASTRATCGATYYLGSQPTIWAEEYQLRVTIGGSNPSCVPAAIVQYFNGAPAPFPCT